MTTTVTHSEPTVPEGRLSIGDLVPGAFRTMTASPKIFFGLPLALTAVFLIPVMVLAGTVIALTVGDERNDSAVGAVILAGLALFLVACYVALRAAGALTIGAYQVAIGQRPSIGDVWRASSGIVIRLLLLGLLVVGAMVTAFLLLVGIAMVGDVGGWLVALLIIVAIPAVVWVEVRLVHVLPVVALEKAMPIAALNRSWHLTRGQWWTTLGRLVLLAVFSWAIQLISTFVFSGVATTYDGGDVGAMAVSVGLAFGVLVFLLLGFVFQVYSSVYLTLMYLDARRREDAPRGVYGVSLIADGHTQPYAAPPPPSYAPQPYGHQPYPQQPHQAHPQQPYPQQPPPPPPAADRPEGG